MTAKGCGFQTWSMGNIDDAAVTKLKGFYSCVDPRDYRQESVTALCPFRDIAAMRADLRTTTPRPLSGPCMTCFKPSQVGFGHNLPK